MLEKEFGRNADVLYHFSDDSYLVFDHCARSMLAVSSGDVIPQLPTKEMSNVGKHLILMTLLENFEGKTIEMVRNCSQAFAMNKV